MSPSEREKSLAPFAGHVDRELGLAVLQSLVAAEPAPPSLAAVLDEVLLDDARHGARLAAALAAIAPIGTSAAPLVHALDDELELVRSRVAAGRLARHGGDRLRPVMAALVTRDAVTMSPSRRCW